MTRPLLLAEHRGREVCLQRVVSPAEVQAAHEPDAPLHYFLRECDKLWRAGG